MKLILDIPEHMNEQLNRLAKERAMTKAGLVRWALGALFKEELEDDRTRTDQ